MENKAQEIKMVEIEKIVANPKNTNKHPPEQLDRLKKIIEFQGFREPLVVSNRSGFLVCGHGRLEVAKSMGAKTVPVIFQDFENEAQEYAHMVADNEIARWAKLDEDLLKNEIKTLGLEDLDNLGVFDLSFLDEVEVKKFEEDKEDDELSLSNSPVTKKGDVWVLGEHRLMCGDSTMIDDVEKLCGTLSADLVFTDPPYGVDYPGVKNDGRDELEELLRGAFGNYVLKMKKGASIYCFHSDKCADIFHKVFREFFHFSSMIIWNKPSLVLSRTDYQSKHEPCLYGWEKNGTHKWHGDRKQVSVWDFGKEKKDENIKHTTPKPVELVVNALQNSSKKNDVVLDLFAGSGSTLIACEKVERKCLTMELDERYCDLIIQRWQTLQNKKATLESTGETYDAIRARTAQGSTQNDDASVDEGKKEN